MNGIDTAADVRPHLSDLSAAGIAWIGRYITPSTRPGKTLMPSEAQAIHAAGLGIAPIWESNPTYPEYFTESQGQLDGSSAVRAMRTFGMPDRVVLWITVDVDIVSARVETYLTAVLNEIAPTPYRLGVYGSGAVCEHFVAEGIAAFGWLAESTKWSRYDEYKSSSKWTIYQYQGLGTLGLPADCTDRNISQPSFAGLWLPPVVA